MISAKNVVYPYKYFLGLLYDYPMHCVLNGQFEDVALSNKYPKVSDAIPH
jgi:hypothetical protein